MEHKLTADVYASYSDIPPRYRIFVDGDLLTERDFVWPGPEIFIRENIFVNLNPGNHRLEITQVSGSGHITVKNITLDGNNCSYDFVTV